MTVCRRCGRDVEHTHRNSIYAGQVCFDSKNCREYVKKCRKEQNDALDELAVTEDKNGR